MTDKHEHHGDWQQVDKYPDADYLSINGFPVKVCEECFALYVDCKTEWRKVDDVH